MTILWRRQGLPVVALERPTAELSVPFLEALPDLDGQEPQADLPTALRLQAIASREREREAA